MEATWDYDKAEYDRIRLAGEWPPKVSRVGHPRRCQAMSRKNIDGLCGNWATKGMRCCKWHGGNKKSGFTVTSRGLYAQNAKSTLAGLIDQVGNHEDHRLSLRSELEAARAMALHSMNTFGAALEIQEGANKLALQQLAAEHAHKSLQLVQKLVLDMAKVQVIDPRVMDIEQIEGIITKVSNVLSKHLNQDQILPILDDIRQINVNDSAKPIQIVL